MIEYDGTCREARMRAFRWLEVIIRDVYKQGNPFSNLFTKLSEYYNQNPQNDAFFLAEISYFLIQEILHGCGDEPSIKTHYFEHLLDDLVFAGKREGVEINEERILQFIHEQKRKSRF